MPIVATKTLCEFVEVKLRVLDLMDAADSCITGITVGASNEAVPI